MKMLLVKKCFLLFVLLATAFSQAQAPFITTWEVEENDLSITISRNNNCSQNYNYSIDFGDGTIVSNVTDSYNYEYADPGIYMVQITGDFPGIRTYGNSKLLTIEQWGDIEWECMEQAFSGHDNLFINATDAPDLSQVTSLANMFSFSDNFNSPLNHWDVSNITDMFQMFAGSENFNQPLNSWDVSNVSQMISMFQGADSFNSSLNSWDVSSVTNMFQMFQYAENFNQSIGDWDVSSVTSFQSMFEGAVNFNQQINSWDVSNVINVDNMFSNATSFNQSIDSWDVSSVMNMHRMFFNSISFNQPLNSWDVSNVLDMSQMFLNAISFNLPLNNWDMSSVETINRMFQGATSFNSNINSWNLISLTSLYNTFLNATSFNQPIDSWNVSNIVDMSLVFEGATSFNQPLNSWDVANVTSMGGMFANASSFNGLIDEWDVSNVTSMGGLFNGATSFNKPLNSWDVSSVINMTNMFKDATSFNQPLDSWDTSNVTNIASMFEDATSFNQPIHNWDVSSVNSFTFGDSSFVDFLDGTNLSVQNLDMFLDRLVDLNITNHLLGADGLEYCNQAAWSVLDNEREWFFDPSSVPSVSPNCNTISGTVAYDANTDGCDINDIEGNGFFVRVDNGTISFNSLVIDGTYEIPVVATGSFEVSLINLPDYFDAVPETETVIFPNANANQIVDFCLTANQAVNDLTILLVPTDTARPGFEASYSLVIQNTGNEDIEMVNAVLQFDDTLESFVSASPSPNVVSSNQLEFAIPSIGSLQTVTVAITMQIMTPPTVEEDDILTYVATVTPVVDDNTPDDNSYVYDQIVVNSFDPNDKQVLQGDELFIGDVENYLDYIIRFQNTGTANATFVTIEDVLDDKLDWETLQIIDASHSYEVNIVNSNEVTFYFDAIDLPFEAADPEGSQGYIAFRIKPKSNVQLGDIISGSAAIYFDYNAPIITNTVTTTIIEPDQFPVAICQDLQVELDANGIALLDASLIGENSTDDHGISSYEVSPQSLDCTQLGFNDVTITITDTAGNQSTCNAVIEVVDILAPIVSCSGDLTQEILPGEMYILPDYIANGQVSALDNCTNPITSSSQFPSPGTGLAQGDHLIEFEFIDTSQNVEECFFTLSVSEILNISENEVRLENILIFPNPTQGNLTFTYQYQEIKSVEVFSVSGKKLFFRENINSLTTTLDVSGLSNGIYLARINGAEIIKIIKN